MEAVPRLPMLSFDFRISTEIVDFSTKLKQYIKNYYNEDPVLYASGITGIENMRREAVHPAKSITGCSLLKRYFCQLHFLSSRFPLHENEEASVRFSWKSLYSNSVVTLNDISLELASILYNIGALHTQLGAIDNRTTAEGMKMSCTHFQCAAWAFQHISEEYPFVKSLGFSPALLSFMHCLCLAQAQECILEKSMMDNRKSAITAKVAIQVVDYYKESLNLLSKWPQDESNSSAISNLKVYKTWNKYLTFKTFYYESISLLFQGQNSEDQQKMGERVTFYQAAYEKLEEARKLSLKDENLEIINEALTFLGDVVEAKKRVAKNENEFIYHEDVPSLTHLPKIKGASLVKGIPFNINDPEVSGPDLFSSIVPMKAHESASLYSEEKAKILRRINVEIENKDEELETFLSMLDLDEIKYKLNSNKLPQELVDKCALMSAKPDAVQNLTEAMNKLADIYHDVESMLAEIQELLNEEEKKEAKYQQILGKRPPSIAATDLTREAKKYQEAHAKASESNQTLHKAMMLHSSNLKLLCQPLKELINHLPTVSESPEVAVITNEMRHLISKVEEMKKQRQMLSEQLRDLVRQDDITKQLVIYAGDKVEELFKQELKKYDKLLNLIEQNLLAQENILKALKDAYANYGSTRKNTGEMFRKRTSMISSLIASYDAYEDLLTKSSKGLDFYKKLETNVSKLLQRVRGTCKVQEEEREQLLKNVTKSETENFQSDLPTSAPLTLKDYLNIKKETGKLSLEHSPSVTQVTSYLNDGVAPQQNWMTGIRPAQVGSEKIENCFNNPSDSFTGFYQGQGKEQVWSNVYYSGPQNADQKLKYFLPESSNDLANYPQNPAYSSSKDAYPISSYSTVLPKLEGQSGYEPKSNYYDTHGSPNRYYNSAQSHNTNLPNSSIMPSHSTFQGNYTQTPMSNSYNQNPSEISSCNYTIPTSNTYSSSQSNIPQQSFNTFSNQPEAFVSRGNYSIPSQHLESQPQVSTTYAMGSFSQTNLAFQSSQSSDIPQIPFNSNTLAYSSPQIQSYNDDYNALSANQSASVYCSSATESTTIPTFSNNYPIPSNTVLGSGSGTQCTTQQPVQIMENVQNYLPYLNNFTPDNLNVNKMANSQSYVYANSTVPYTGYQIPGQPASGTEVTCPWSDVYSSPQIQHYAQPGNESLYTVSQSINNYPINSSDSYKVINQETYGIQYSNNQNVNMSQNNKNFENYDQNKTNQQQLNITTSNSETKLWPTPKSSNLDLLSGLDININHSPLMPETMINKKEEEQTNEIAELKTVSKSVNSLEPSLKININKDPNQDKVRLKDVVLSEEYLTQLAQDVEKYEKFVEGLTQKTLNGPTNLDLKWKEIVDVQEKINPLHIISVARCYPMKNRFPDILPYDDSRVELPSTKDDYINASRMTNLTNLAPNFILTQAPLPSTYGDFWTMVFEQQVEVIICLLSDSELDNQIYWPVERNQELELGKVKISLQSSNIRTHWVERILSICWAETKMTRVIVHLQFTAWPGSSFPESSGPFLSFSAECLNFFTQQRSYNHPVVVHCISGVGRTGLFCLIIASLTEIQTGKGIPDLVTLAGHMSQFRKGCLRDREHLKFAYQAVLYYCRDFLLKRGIQSSRYKSKEETNQKILSSEEFSGSSTTEMDQLQSDIKHIKMDDGKVESTSKTVTELEKRESNNKILNAEQSIPSTLSKNLSNIDSGNFSLRMDSSNQKKKKFTPESFNKTSSMETNKILSDDPLSQLDPLWTIKK